MNIPPLGEVFILAAAVRIDSGVECAGNYFNGIGRVTWQLTFEPNQSKELGCQWHYFWR
jgi:hypothetical protein